MRSTVQVALIVNIAMAAKSLSVVANALADGRSGWRVAAASSAFTIFGLFSILLLRQIWLERRSNV